MVVRITPHITPVLTELQPDVVGGGFYLFRCNFHAVVIAFVQMLHRYFYFRFFTHESFVQPRGQKMPRHITALHRRHVFGGCIGGDVRKGPFRKADVQRIKRCKFLPAVIVRRQENPSRSIVALCFLLVHHTHQTALDRADRA